MNVWTGLALFITLYLLIPMLFGIRGAFISFFLPVLGFFFFGLYFFMHDPNSHIDDVTAIGILFTGAFGGPFLFVFLLWLIGFPVAAVGLWLNGKIKKCVVMPERQVAL